MDSEQQFEQLARRDTELRALATRGRRRSLLIMFLAYIPIPFVLIAITNNDHDLVGLIPLGVTFVVGISYSWTKWQRRPEDSQSVAFVGLDRKRRWATYRSMLRGSRIDDPVVLTIVESIHQHLRRSVVVVVATIVAIAVTTVVLVETGSDSVSPWIPAAIVVLAGGAIAEHRWIINRSALVIARSRL
jgi:hypothetical protein